MNRRLVLRFATPLATLSILVAGAAGAAGEPAGQFLTGPNPGDAHDVAVAYITSQLDTLGLTAADVEGMAVQDRYTTRHNGATHLYFQQRHDGIDVYNGVINVNIAADGSVISLGNRFVGDLAAKAAGSPALSDRQAIERAATHFGLTAHGLAPLTTAGGPDQRAVFAAAALSRDDIPVRLVYQPLDDGRARLAWETVLNLVDSSDWWSVRVDAGTGEVLSQYNWTSYDSYRVIPFPPFSDPEDFGGEGQAVVTDPADPVASPFGWHDTDGAPGAESTLTRGNNVNAQEDQDANNSGGFSPDGGPTLDFLFDWDPSLQPATSPNLEASIVNLFYANNVMHDITYCYGFDEPAGNFQTNNYGNGGLGNDEVEADALDGSGTNNANFSTPPDGFSGRMQMFIWTNPFSQLVTVNSPGSIAGDYVANPSNNGGTGMGLTGDLEIVDDGVAPTTDACEAVNNDLTDKIALIVWNQGACNSSVFVANAANAGAVGAIIVDNNVNPTTNFGGSPLIPSVGVGSDDGQLFIDTITGGDTVNATLDDNPDGTINRDSDLDNGIIAHEFGHGVSNRLIGGPSNVNCIGGSERAGEGWSDFFTVVLTPKSSDTPELGKGVGNYAIFEPVNGPGIRNFPYSTDLTVNPQTYIDINDAATSVPHGVGSIFNTMLWEMYWELTLKHGLDCDFCTGTGGNNLTIQLVMDGMKMGLCNPTFVDSRDAILMADMVNNGGANECEIWRAFAKRGVGLSADGGSINRGDEVEAFDLPAHCPAVAPSIFTDGFECGDTQRWTSRVGISN